MWSYAYRRKDGVFVVLIGCLKDLEILKIKFFVMVCIVFQNNCLFLQPI